MSTAYANKRAETVSNMYFNAFTKLFGKEPVWPSEEVKTQAYEELHALVTKLYNEYGNDPAANRIIDCDVIDLMEKFVKQY